MNISGSLRIAYRYLSKNKLLSFINILGFSLGLTAFSLVILFVQYERSYDRYHENADRILRITEQFKSPDGTLELAATPFPLRNALINEMPQAKATRLYEAYRLVPTLTNKETDKSFREENLYFTDSSFFDIFSYDLVYGSKQALLDAPNTLILDRTTSTKYFGQGDPVGKILYMEGELPLQVTGVIEDIPLNSHFQFNCLVSLQNTREILDATGLDWSHEGWYWTAVRTYILLPKKYESEDLETVLSNIQKKYVSNELQETISFSSQPLTDIHLKSKLILELSENRNESEIQIAIIIAILILFLSISNYINLYSANTFYRIKEFSIEKILGSSKARIIFRIIIESSLIALISFIISLVFIALIIPLFNGIFDSHISFADLLNPNMVGLLLTLVLVVGVISGVLPGIQAAAIPSTSILSSGKGTKMAIATKTPRDILIGIQFTVSLALIISSITIYRQYQFLTEKSLGFDETELISIPIRHTRIKGNYKLFRDLVTQHPAIENASLTSHLPGSGATMISYKLDENAEETFVSTYYADHTVIDTWGVSLVEGRNFVESRSSDTSAYLINKRGLEILKNGWENTIIDGNEKIIGVVSDFYFSGVDEAITPLLIKVDTSWASYIMVKFKPDKYRDAIEHIEESWFRIEPDKPPIIAGLKETLGDEYKGQQQLSNMITLFCFISLVLASIGLIGLSLFFVKQKSFETGIKKVLGASQLSLLWDHYRYFVILVAVATAVSIPFTIWMLNGWLQDFPLHVEVSFLSIVLSVLILLFTTVCSSLWNIIKSMMINPVEILSE